MTTLWSSIYSGHILLVKSTRLSSIVFFCTVSSHYNLQLCHQPQAPVLTLLLIPPQLLYIISMSTWCTNHLFSMSINEGIFVFNVISGPATVRLSEKEKNEVKKGNRYVIHNCSRQLQLYKWSKLISKSAWILAGNSNYPLIKIVKSNDDTSIAA